MNPTPPRRRPLPQPARLENEAERSDEEWRSRLAKAWASGGDLPLVAEIGGDMVGLVWGRIDPAAPESVHVYQMWVAPEMRGRGLGRMLLSAVLAWARNAEVRHVHLLCVTNGDTSARRLYESVGFVAVGSPEPLRPGSTLVAQSLVLDLTDPLSLDRRLARPSVAE